MVMSFRERCFWWGGPWPVVRLAPESGGRPLAHHVCVDGDEDDDAEDDVLPFLRDRHELEPVVEDGDDEGADDGSDDRSLASGEGGSADDDGGDGLELV